MGNWWDGITNAAGNLEGGLVDAFTGGSYSKLKAAGQATNTIPQPQFQPAGGPRTDTTGLLAPGASMPSLAGNSHMPTAATSNNISANVPMHSGGQVSSYGPGGSVTPIAMPTPSGNVSGTMGNPVSNPSPAAAPVTVTNPAKPSLAPPAAGAPIPFTPSPMESASSGYLNQLTSNLNKGFETGQGIVGKVDALGNSYDPNGSAFQGYLAGQLGRTADSFAGADHQLRASLAARGMLDSGAEQAGLANIAAQRSNAMAQTQSQAYQDAMDKGNQFNLDRYGLEANANSSAMSGGLGLLSGGANAALAGAQTNHINQMTPLEVQQLKQAITSGNLTLQQQQMLVDMGPVGQAILTSMPDLARFGATAATTTL